MVTDTMRHPDILLCEKGAWGQGGNMSNLDPNRNRERKDIL